MLDVVRRQVVVEVVVVEGEVNGSAVHTAVDSVVVDGAVVVAVETGCCSKVVDSKFVQIR